MSFTYKVYSVTTTYYFCVCIVCVCVCVCLSVWNVVQKHPVHCSCIVLTSICKLQTTSPRYHWVRLLNNSNIYNQTHISKGCPHFRCTSGTSCLFKNNIWQFLQKPCTVPAKVKISVSLSNFSCMITWDDLEKLQQFKIWLCLSNFTHIPAEMKQKHIAVT
jgi:hypothetical protein